MLYTDLVTANTLSLMINSSEPVTIPQIVKTIDTPYHIVSYRLNKLFRMGYVTKVDVTTPKKTKNCLWVLKQKPKTVTVKNNSVLYRL